MIVTGSLLLSLSVSTMASEVYKWVDAQGVTHFGSQPPQGQEATQINTTLPPPKAPTSEGLPAPEDLPPLDSAEPDQEAIDEKVRQEVAAKEAERRKYCETVRTNLSQLQNNPRVRVAEENGEMRRLTEEERQERIEEAQQAIAEHCN
jgi:hypothetical protein